MSEPFARSACSLAGDTGHRPLACLLLVVALLAAWLAWLLFAKVELLAVTDQARLEVVGLIHPVETPIAGKVAASHLLLGRDVTAGDVLVELDAQEQHLALAEEEARLAASSGEVEVLRRGVAAQEQAQHEEQAAALAALDVARARQREGEALAQLAEDKLARTTRLQADGMAADTEILQAKGEAQKERAAADALALGVKQMELEAKTRQSDRTSELEKFRRDVARLEGQMAISAATIKRLEYEIERHRIRATATGRLGEVAELRTGSVVRPADKLATVVPAGELKIVADYAPFEALGRVRPGQAACLRLYGFPWMQYGSIPATVASVGSELREGRVRVELLARLAPDSLIPCEHALPGSLEVEVDHASPAALLLRVAGKLLR